MAAVATTWQSYEEVARFLLNEFADRFGLGHVEGKQVVAGISGTEWEIDAKGLLAGGTGFLVVECRRYTTSRLKQKDLAALAYTISDTGAAGGIVVTPLDLQEGAKRIAATAGIIHMTLRPDSTTTDYLLRFLNTVFVGVSDTWSLSIRDSAVVKIVRADGSVEVPSTDDDV